MQLDNNVFEAADSFHDLPHSFTAHCIEYFGLVDKYCMGGGVVVNVLDHDIVVSEFDLPSHSYNHFLTNTPLGKVMNILTPSMA